MINVTDLVYDYPGLRALDDVSFTIRPGTITALVGPNGAGKSTLMRCMAALDRPMAGTVVIDGIDAHEQPRETHARMGYLPDFFGLYNELSVRRCLEYKAAAQGLPKTARAAAVQTAAGRMNLGDRMNQRAGALSRGLRQRLAIAQAIIHEPKVVMLDEPASGLDPEARIALSEVLRGLCADGMTLIVSSHILSELEDYATDMLIIRNGKLVDHRALDGRDVTSGAAPTQRINVGLVAADARLAEVLEGIEGVSLPAVEGRNASFSAPADPRAQAAILAALLAADLAVCNFGPDRARLRDAYMAQLGDGEQGGAGGSGRTGGAGGGP